MLEKVMVGRKNNFQALQWNSLLEIPRPLGSKRSGTKNPQVSLKLPSNNSRYVKKKSKAMHTIGHESPLVSEMLSLPRFLDSSLTDGGKIAVSHANLHLPPGKFLEWISFKRPS
jgi:hypothetical protein